MLVWICHLCEDCVKYASINLPCLHSKHISDKNADHSNPHRMCGILVQQTGGITSHLRLSKQCSHFTYTVTTVTILTVVVFQTDPTLNVAVIVVFVCFVVAGEEVDLLGETV